MVSAEPPAWMRSLPSVDAVVALVEDAYGFDAARVVLVRSFVNDVYRIDADDRTYALKVYGVGRWSTDEVRWEQQLARHLDDAGVPVSAPVPLRSGDTVGVLAAPEGDRPFALTTWVPGMKPQPPWTDSLYRDVGAALARFHLVADTLASDQPRHPVRIGAHAPAVIAVLGDDADRRGLVQRSVEAAGQEIERLAADGLHWGIRHGDPSLDNLHVGRVGVQFYDFDLAGPGWQVEDLTGALSTDFAGVFLAGYTAVKPLSPVELEALPWLRILGTVDNLHFHLIGKPAVLGTSTLTEGWVDEGFASLAAVARQVGLAD